MTDDSGENTMEKMNLDRRNRRISFRLAGVWMLAGLAGMIGAQENLGRARISGTVVDEGGSALAGVQIRVLSLQGNAVLDGRTDGRGFFAVAGLGTGTWRITASLSGYQDDSREMEVRQLRTNPSITLTLKKAVTPVVAVTDREAAGLLEQGNRLVSEEKFAPARAAFERFLEKFPDAYPVRLHVGICRLKEGAPEGAAREFQRLLDTIDRTFGSRLQAADLATKALAGLGEAAVKMNDRSGQERYFTQALALSPGNEILAYNVAEIMFANQQTDDAIRYYTQAIAIRREWSKPVFKLGMAWLNKGDYAKSLQYLRQFVAMDPGSPETTQAKSVIETIEKIGD